MTPADLIVASQPLGEAEAARIAARYGVRCAPDVPVLRARRGAMAAPNPDDPRIATANAWAALQRRRRFQAAARKAGAQA